MYGVAVATGQDPALDGLILRHLLIQAVRRGALLDATCEGLDVEGCRIDSFRQEEDLAVPANHWRRSAVERHRPLVATQRRADRPQTGHGTTSPAARGQREPTGGGATTPGVLIRQLAQNRAAMDRPRAAP